MESSQRPTTPEAPLAQSNMESVPTNINTTTPANEHLTTLSEGAYAGPTKEDLALLCTHAASKAQEKKVSIDDVVKGFRDLGKAMSASDLLTTLLHALAKDETETLFEWLLWERFKDNPPADGMGHWERLCSVIPNLDKSWYSLNDKYEEVIRQCSESSHEEYPFGPTVTWSTISPNSDRQVTPTSPAQHQSSPTPSFTRSPLKSKVLSPISQHRKRNTPEPSFEPAISFPKPLGGNEAQEAIGNMKVQPSKRAKLPPAADMPASD